MSAMNAAEKISANDNAVASQGELTDGFHLVIDALKLNDLTTLYAVPGIPISDLLRMAQGEGLRVISFRHEQNAGYAASIAGFMTGKPGVCLTVSAPGFLNGLTALAHATTNCFPMILISGSSEREIVDLQQGDYEEMDQLAIARPHAKAAFRVLHAEDIGVGVARAIRAAVSGRPGGVYLDLPAKLFPQAMDAVAGKASLIKVVDPAPKQIPAHDAVERAVDLLRSAKKPLVILGKGAAYAQCDAEVRALIERTGIPYLPMSMAKGLLPDTHEQCASAARSFVLPEADVVVLLGARLNWLLSQGKGKTWGAASAKAWGRQKFVQVDISPTGIHVIDAIERAPGDVYVTGSALMRTDASAAANGRSGGHIWRSQDGGPFEVLYPDFARSVGGAEYFDLLGGFVFGAALNGTAYFDVSGYIYKWDGGAWDGWEAFGEFLTPSVFAGRIVFGSTGQLFAFDGQKRTNLGFRSFESPGRYQGSKEPIMPFQVTEGHLIAAAFDGHLMETTDLTSWHCIGKVPADTSAVGSLDGVVYFGTTKSQVYGLPSASW